MSDGEGESGGIRRLMRNADSMMLAVIMAILLWTGNTTYSNSILLTKLGAEVAALNAQGAQRQALFESIWPRLREIKERVQHLESLQPSSQRATQPWRY